jgi:type I restriction enzyme S subunit
VMDQYELPRGWCWATFQDLGAIISGGTPPTSDPENFDGSIPWITPADLTGYARKTIDRGRRNLSEKGLRSSSARIIPRRSVLFSSRAPIGYVAIAANDLTTNQGFKSIAVSEEIDESFVYYYLKAAKRLAEANASGTTFKEISASKFAQLPIPVAPLPEQRRIVEKIESLFAELDKGEESLRQLQVLLARYRQSVLKAAVTGELTADWRAQRAGQLEHGRDLLARILKARRENWQGRGKYKEPNQPDINGLPELPENWAWATLESLAANAAHAMVDGPFGSKLKTEHYTKSGVRVIRLENIGDGVFIDKKSYISEEHAAELQRHSISGGDIVIASLGVQLPKACIVPDRIGTAIVKADCIKFSPNMDFVVPDFIMAWLNSPQLRRRVAVSIRGVGRPRLNLADLRSLAVPLPSWEEQRVIARLTEASERFVHSIDYCCVAALKQSSALRQSILNTAFSGKLVPQELSDEPASELLARVRAQRSAQPEKSKRRKTSV